MKELREAILRQGFGVGTEIVKVDMFLNHRLDVALLTKMGEAFHDAFRDVPVDMILTVESSGIAAAITTAQAFGNVPVIFARKGSPKNLGSDVYHSRVFSFTHGVELNHRPYLAVHGYAYEHTRLVRFHKGKVHHAAVRQYIRTRFVQKRHYALIRAHALRDRSHGHAVFMAQACKQFDIGAKLCKVRRDLWIAHIPRLLFISFSASSGCFFESTPSDAMI